MLLSSLKKNNDFWRKIIPTFILVILLFLLIISLFKNLSHPLLWNDESYGAMEGQRVLTYGYPKVHDGKNVVLEPNKSVPFIGYLKQYDVYSAINFGNAYYSAIGVWLSQFATDIYQKTFLVRFPFVLAGFIGLLFFLLIIKKTYRSKKILYFATFSYIFFILTSVSLILHLRQARYYPLVILFIAAIFYLYYINKIKPNMNRWLYIISLSLLLFTLYQINFISMVIVSLTIAINEIINIIHIFIRNKKIQGWRNTILLIFESSGKEIIALTLTIIICFPFVIIFQNIQQSQAITKYFSFNFHQYLYNFQHILNYLGKYEWFGLLVVTTIINLILYKTILLFYPNYQQKLNRSRQFYRLKYLQRVSIILFILCLTLFAYTPVYLMVRHFLFLIPLCYLIIVNNIVITFYLLRPFHKIPLLKYSSIIIIAITLVIIGINTDKYSYLNKYWHQLKIPLKGPLDVTIPYILTNYHYPEKLTIATDYETTSYMFYLGSKVTIGYTKNNFFEDLNTKPDIIIYRKYLLQDPSIFNIFLRGDKYQQILFPLFDSPTNDLPQLEFTKITQHRFKTKYTKNEQEMVQLFVLTSKLRN